MDNYILTNYLGGTSAAVHLYADILQVGRFRADMMNYGV